MFEGWTYFLTGVVVGLAGGFSPGPITTLVIAQSVRYGVTEGLKIAVAPLLTDAPVALVALMVIGRLADADQALGIIALLGAGFLTYLASEGLRVRGLDVGTESAGPQSLKKGALTNFLNPNPYLFWFTIGAPTVYDAYALDGRFVAMFLVGLYACLVGAKMSFAIIAGHGRVWLTGASYVYTMRALGVALFVFALKFARDGLDYLDVL